MATIARSRGARFEELEVLDYGRYSGMIEISMTDGDLDDVWTRASDDVCAEFGFNHPGDFYRAQYGGRDPLEGRR